jgi:hypothetical protein
MMTHTSGNLLPLFHIQDVAIKTILLPSNMAGAEKREKMVRVLQGSSLFCGAL